MARYNKENRTLVRASNEASTNRRDSGMYARESMMTFDIVYSV